MNTFFWLWLLDHPQHQAQYLYNYEGQLDKERIAELKAKNAELETQVHKLEESKAPKEFTADVDPDLMWTTDKVVAEKAAEPVEIEETNVESSWAWLGWTFGLCLLAVIFWLLLFYIDWN